MEKFECTPVTKYDLENVFHCLGLKKGLDIVVHSGLKRLGYIVNGAHDVIEALLSSVGKEGTIIMPAHSGQLTDPADWKKPPVDPKWIPIIRDNMKMFDPQTTEIRGRGMLAQFFLTYPGVLRSDHPLNSVSALGAKAEYYTEEHPLHESEGIGSPAWRLYNSGGHVLLIDVEIQNSLTFIHLGEFMLDMEYLKHGKIKVLTSENGQRKFTPLKKYPITGSAFVKLHPMLEGAGLMRKVMINEATLYFFPFKQAIDMTIQKMKEAPHYWSGISKV